MDRQVIDRVRAFNRTVTQRVGALDDRYLARDRSLGAARVLWEIGDDGRDVRAIRARLGLDSGYLSRLLRSLEAAGLVTVGPSEGDGRVRTIRLTGRGRAERALLDERSDDLARSMVEPLTDGQRERLVSAMSEVQRLLTATLVEFEAVDPMHDRAQRCLREYFGELDRRFDTGFDPGEALPLDPEELRPPAGVFVVASLRHDPVGCGGLKFHQSGVAELKRMWIASEARRLGVGRRLLGELERRAAERGSCAVRLDTNGTLVEAISLYRSSGYQEIARFNDEPYADHWFEKHLGEPPATS